MKKFMKLIIDFCMIIFIPLLFGIKNNLWHEVLGLAFFMFITIHFVLNYKELKALIKNKLKLIYSILIAVCILFVAASGILNSQYIFNFIKVSDSQIFRSIHLFAATTAFVLIAIHVGLNIKKVKESFNDKIKTSRAKTIAVRSILILIIIYGLYACYAQHIWNNFIQPFNYSKSANEITFDNNTQNKPTPPDGAGQDNNSNSSSSDSNSADNSDPNSTDNQDNTSNDKTNENIAQKDDNKTPPDSNNNNAKPNEQTMPGNQSFSSKWYKTFIDYSSIFVLLSTAAYFIAKSASKPKKINDDEII